MCVCVCVWFRICIISKYHTAGRVELVTQTIDSELDLNYPYIKAQSFVNDVNLLVRSDVFFFFYQTNDEI